MLAATSTKYGNCSNKSTIYEQQNWIDIHKTQVPWLNFLISQSIPEETDTIDSPNRIRNYSDSSSSSLSSTTSIEESYIVLEVQRPRPIEKPLNFAQIKEDIHRVEHEQMTKPIITKIPLKQMAAIEYHTEQFFMNTERVKIKQTYIHEPKKYNNNSFHSRNQRITSSFSIPKEHIRNRLCSMRSSTYSIDTSDDKSTLGKTSLTRTFTFNSTRTDKSIYTKEDMTNSFNTCDENETIPSQSSIFRRSGKRRSRHVLSEYYVPGDELQTNQPTLLQVKYLDGRPTLTNMEALESLQKSQLLTTSASSKLNTSKISLSQDSSYRKRILNRVQTFLKPSTNELSKSGQQKTVLQIFNEITI